MYINRELSWIDFNNRVLDQACRTDLPLLEQLKFLAIVSSNFDEFFMVRVSSLKKEVATGDKISCPSGLKPSEILKELSARIHEMLNRQETHYLNHVLPELSSNCIAIAEYNSLSNKNQIYCRQYFQSLVLAALSPVRITSAKDLLIYSPSATICIFFRFEDDTEVLVQCPENLPRFIEIPGGTIKTFVRMEDLITCNSDLLFTAKTLKNSICIRITKDADMSVDEQRDEDFVTAMEEVLQQRDLSIPIRLEIQENDSSLSEYIGNLLEMDDVDIYKQQQPLGFREFMKLCSLPGTERYQIAPWVPQPHPAFSAEASVWDLIKEKDILLHHPYHSFSHVIQMIESAANDPKVTAIKMTLYRTSGNSPIIKSLKKAAENGKQVMALVELKARFDESRNLIWAEELRKAGAIVIYGIAKLKVHSKALLIVRKEQYGFVRYAHLGTGNYNEQTAKLYTDISLLTAHTEMTTEVMQFFNTITGYSDASNLQHLSMAPLYLRGKTMQLIEQETIRAKQGQKAEIIAKMNSLVDKDIIDALYNASKAGVKIRLNIRGICTLRANVKGLSENITIVSIIDRYLEHSRIFYFHNAGQEEIYLSSADWMPRNLDKRIEIMFPVYAPEPKKTIIKLLHRYFEDNTQSYYLQNNNKWKLSRTEGKPIRIQEYCYLKAVKENKAKQQSNKKTFKVRKALN